MSYSHENGILIKNVVARFMGAMDHPSEKARENYLKKHPKADPKNHKVKDKSDSGPSSAKKPGSTNVKSLVKSFGELKHPSKLDKGERIETAKKLLQHAGGTKKLNDLGKEVFQAAAKARKNGDEKEAKRLETLSAHIDHAVNYVGSGHHVDWELQEGKYNK